MLAKEEEENANNQSIGSNLVSEQVGQNAKITISELYSSLNSIQIDNAIMAVSKMKQVSEAVSKTVLITQTTIGNNMKRFVEAYNKALPNYEKLLAGITESVSKLMKAIKATSFTEKEKQELIDSYIAWGKLGWTLPPDVGIRVFREKPTDAKDAYKKLRPYLTTAHIQQLIQKLSQEKHIKKTDLNEAADCYNHKHYKGCALILFSMIDSRLIRAQLDIERNHRNLRSTGVTAATNLFNRIEEEYISESMVYTLLNHQNILEALTVFFKRGDDFKKQPIVVNRNFLSHGMLYRPVRQKDCKMLFLLLYNFTLHVNQ